MKKDNFMKFPCALREKLCRGEVVFPQEAIFEYDPIVAYRGIDREETDSSEVTRADFCSYAEKKITRRGVSQEDPHYYGVSLFLEKESVENALKFPRAGKKIARGKVYQEAGPAEVNGITGHICWWLYDNVEIEGFTIC